MNRERHPFEVVRHDGARAFLDRAEAWLLGAEDRHNLILGLAYGRAEKGEEGGDAFFGTIEESGDVVGCAVRTPPHKLLVTDLPLAASAALAKGVGALYDEIPAVLGPAPVAEAVAMAWVDRKGGGWHPGLEQRIYRLDRVAVPSDAPGRLRKAKEEDIELATAWGEAFARDIGHQLAPARDSVSGWVERGLLYLWEDGEPRSITVAHGRTPHGVRIGYVYTPPKSRGRGYASACVAGVSQGMLDEGLDFCVLYTDLSNPTSNALYQRIGYRPIADARDFDLLPADAF